MTERAEEYFKREGEKVSRSNNCGFPSCFSFQRLPRAVWVRWGIWEQ